MANGMCHRFRDPDIAAAQGETERAPLTPAQMIETHEAAIRLLREARERDAKRRQQGAGPSRSKGSFPWPPRGHEI